MNFKNAMILLLFLSVNHLIQAQYKFSSYNAHSSLKEAINVSADIIKARTLDFEKKAEEKPLMFHQVKLKIAELNRIANNLSYYIEDVQKLVDTERVLYDLLEKHHYQDVLFSSNGRLSSKGDRLKVKIDSLYQFANHINIHKLTHLSDFANDHFKTNQAFYDENENQISYFDHLFYDKSNYGMMMAMNYLLLDVKTFQLLYYGTVMSY